MLSKIGTPCDRVFDNTNRQGGHRARAFGGPAQNVCVFVLRDEFIAGEGAENQQS